MVLKEVPPNCTVVGVPGRIVKSANNSLPRSSMNQVDLPDPVYRDLAELWEQNIVMKMEIDNLKKELEERKEHETV